MKIKLLTSLIASAGLLGGLPGIAAADYEYRIPVTGLSVAQPLPPPPPPPSQPAGLTADRTVVEFGDVDLGFTKTERVVFSNTSNEAVLVGLGTLAAPYTLSHDCPASLPAQGVCTADITFVATDKGIASASLAVAGLSASIPLTANGYLSPVAEIHAGSQHVIVKKEDGVWWGAGLNQRGTLGIGTTENQSRFVKIPGLSGAVKVVTLGIATYAQFPGGVWKAAGGNGAGQLGLGDTTDRHSFTEVPSLYGATELVGQFNTVAARKSDGKWYFSGDNSRSQMGYGHTNPVTQFTEAPAAIVNATTVSPTYLAVFAQRNDGAWLAAGDNALGLFANGTYTSQTTFTAVSNLTGVLEIVHGGGHVLLKYANGDWRSAGWNGYGQLGIGSNDASRNTPQTLAGMQNAQFYPLVHSSLVRKADGTWWAAGYNATGQLMLGNTTSRNTFTQINALSGMTWRATAGYSNYFQASDGSWWAAGENTRGQLGIGNLTNQSLPVKIPNL